MVIKKGVKILATSCLCMVIGIVIGSESKHLTKEMNFYPDAVIQSYYKEICIFGENIINVPKHWFK